MQTSGRGNFATVNNETADKAEKAEQDEWKRMSKNQSSNQTRCEPVLKNCDSKLVREPIKKLCKD